MKNKFITLVFVFLAYSSFATHYLSSDISYTHLSGLTYGITIRIYNNTYYTTADRCEITVHFGDGDSLAVPRINGISSICPATHDGEMIATNVNESIYYTTHTYSSAGYYIVSFEDANRTADICNIPNSINIGIYAKAEIMITPFLGYNSTPQFTAVPLNTVCLSSINYYNPSVIETEGDSLFYQLIPPMAYGQAISGYTLPAASNSFSIDALTGTVSWDKPTMICTYSYDIKITEWRKFNGTYYNIGSTMQDVYNIVSASAGIDNFSNEGNISVYPNPTSSNISVEFNVTDKKNVLIEVKNALGQTVKTIDNNFFSNGNNKIEINTNEFQSGLYFVQLYDGNILTNRKFVIE